MKLMTGFGGRGVSFEVSAKVYELDVCLSYLHPQCGGFQVYLPEHKISMKLMTGFGGGGVSFEIDGYLDSTKTFIDALKIPYIAPSFGGCEGIVDQPGIMSYWYV